MRSLCKKGHRLDKYYLWEMTQTKTINKGRSENILPYFKNIKHFFLQKIPLPWLASQLWGGAGNWEETEMCNVEAFDFFVFLNLFFRIFPSFCISVTPCLFFCVVFFRYLVKTSLWGSSTAGWWWCWSSLLCSSSSPPFSSFTTLRLESCCSYF